MFLGFIFNEYMEGSNFVGESVDCGFEKRRAQLLGALISENKLHFKKWYKKQDAQYRCGIDYHFEFKNGVWVGKYKSKYYGSGGAKCILTEVPRDFILPFPKPKK